MATATKTPRLLAAAKEFNIGKETLIEFLTSKGFEINASNPNTKITEEMYDALAAEFAQDKAAKRKSDAIDLPRGGGVVQDLKIKEELPKKEEPKPIPEVKKEEPPKKEEPQPIIPIEEKTEEPQKEEPQPVAEVKKGEPQPEITVAEKEEEPEELPQKNAAKTEEEPATPEEAHIETKSPKLEGPKILDKIKLEHKNHSTSPKKSAAKKD